MAVHICFTGAQFTVLSELLIMWKENWLGKYVEMAYCNTLPAVVLFLWTNILLKTSAVCKRESTNLLLCYWQRMLIGVVPCVSFQERFWHLQGNWGSFWQLCTVELQIIHPITAQRNFSLLAEVEPGRCFLDYQKSKQSHRLQVLVDTRKRRAWGQNPFLTDKGNPSF